MLHRVPDFSVPLKLPQGIDYPVPLRQGYVLLFSNCSQRQLIYYRWRGQAHGHDGKND